MGSRTPSQRALRRGSMAASPSCRLQHGLGPNNAFKPKPLRYAKHMAGTACHVLRFTTRLGLTWVLGLMSAIRAIERVKRPLIIVEILAIVLFAAELLYLRSLGTYHPSTAAGLAFLLPPL